MFCRHLTRTCPFDAIGCADGTTALATIRAGGFGLGEAAHSAPCATECDSVRILTG
jgi:hypothetical protein